MNFKISSKQIKNGLFILLILFSIFVLIFFTALLSVDGDIVEDSPVKTKLCEINPACGSAKVEINCDLSINTDEKSSNYIKLKSWRGFHGCNQSTIGYSERSHLRFGLDKYVELNVCDCVYFLK